MKSIREVSIFALLIFVCSTLCAAVPGKDKSGSAITGRIIDAQTGEPLIGATIMLENKFGGTKSNLEGEYRINGLSPGKYTLQVSNIGYVRLLTEDIKVSENEPTIVNIRLSQKPIALKDITVTPGRFRIMGKAPAAKQSLTRGQIETRPQLGEDLYRAIERLPGVSSTDFSARFNVRGGEYDEVMVTIDGLQIYEPFHLKDIDGGVMSIIDVATVDGVDLMTGGFPAVYGDKMSGVFNISSKKPSEDGNRLSLGLSLMNVRALSEGTFNNGKSSWLVSARRGYIDWVLKLSGADDEIKPTYYDFFGKIRHQLGLNHLLSANFLHAQDDMKYRGKDEDAGDTLLTNYGNTYFWLNLRSALHPKLLVKSSVYSGRVSQDRYGQMIIQSFQKPDVTATNVKGFDVLGFKTDWEYDLSDRYLFKFGVDVKTMSADYDYLSRQFEYNYQSTPDSSYLELDHIDSTLADLDKSGRKIGAYLANRFNLFEPFTAEIGIRYDHVSYTDDELFSPRVNLVYSFNKRTSIRGGWGHFYQTDDIHDIAVGDGQTEFFPAQRAEHRVIGLEHHFPSGVDLRLEGYYKKYSDLKPDLRNSFDDIEAFPELENDRVIVFRDRATSRGLELFLKKDYGGRFSWWAGYALAKTEDHVSKMIFADGTEVKYDRELPSPNDQRHTVYLDLNYRPNLNWQLNVAWQYHSGWPFTDAFMATEQTGPNNYNVYLQSGEQWAARHSPFSRLDVRLNRYIKTSKGRIGIYLEIINLFNRKNVRGYDYDIYYNGRRYLLDREPEHWFGLLPSIGITYNWGI